MNKIQENAPIWTKFCINKKANKKMGGGRWNKRTTRKKGEKTLPSNFKFFFYLFFFFTLNFSNEKKMKKRWIFFCLFLSLIEMRLELMKYSRVVVHIIKTKGVSSYFLFFRRRLLRIWNPRPSTPINVGERGIHIRPSGRSRVDGRMQTSERIDWYKRTSSKNSAATKKYSQS